MDPLERKWLNFSALCGVIIHFSLFALGLRHQTTVHPNLDAGHAAEIFLLLTVFSLPLTLFLVAIPFRIAMNLLVKGRRKPKWPETAVLALTFVLLGVAFYSIATYREVS